MLKEHSGKSDKNNLEILRQQDKEISAIRFCHDDDRVTTTAAPCTLLGRKSNYGCQKAVGTSNAKPSPWVISPHTYIQGDLT
jgi:hypothetical protein